MKSKGKSILRVGLTLLAVCAFSFCTSAAQLVSADTGNLMITQFYSSDNNLTASGFQSGTSITVTSTRDYHGSHNDLFGLAISGLEGENVITLHLTNVGDLGNDTLLKLAIRANESMENQFDDTFLQIERVIGGQLTMLDMKDCAYIPIEVGQTETLRIIFKSNFTSNTVLKFSPYAFGVGFVGKLMVSDITVGDIPEEPVQSGDSGQSAQSGDNSSNGQSSDQGQTNISGNNSSTGSNNSSTTQTGNNNSSTTTTGDSTKKPSQSAIIDGLDDTGKIMIAILGVAFISGLALVAIWVVNLIKRKNAQ